jgi:hypothetical protein
MPAPDQPTATPAAAPPEPSAHNRRPKQGLPWWFWHLFTAMGLITLTTGVLVLSGEVRFAGLAQPATGTVIGYSQHQDIGDDTWMYAPIVQFETSAGERYEFSSGLKSTTRQYEIGQRVGVLYDPANPNKAQLAGAGARYFAPAILLLLALVFTPLGILGQHYIGRGLARQA